MKGKLILINGTEHAFRKTDCHSYQMFCFKFPQLVSSATCEICEIEWSKNAFIDEWINEGSVTYELVGTSYSFTIMSRINSGFDIYVSYVNLSNLGNNFIKLEWIKDQLGFMQFYLCGRVDRFVSTGSFSGAHCWMQQNLDLFGPIELYQLSMPGSHDSGMSEVNWRSTFANPNNCKNQSLNIYDQLMHGIRYFDLRIVIGSQSFHTGHYVLVGKLEYQGARGQSLETVIQQINNFTACNTELIVLSLSHLYNLDLGRHSRPLNQTEFDSLCFKLMEINYRFISFNDDINLLDKSLNNFIGNKKSAVLIVLNDSELKIDPKKYLHKGFYTRNEFQVIDKYSNSNSLNTMITDQINKLNQNRSKNSNNYFLLSWTLTQQNIQTFSSVFGPSISAMAFLANSNLIRLLSSDLKDLNLKNFVNKAYPNVISMDYVNVDVTAICLAINLFKNQDKRTNLLYSLNYRNLGNKLSHKVLTLIRRYLIALILFIMNYLFHLVFYQ